MCEKLPTYWRKLLGTSRCKGYSSEDVRRRLLWNYLGLVDG
jgi:hypothetical protein